MPGTVVPPRLKNFPLPLRMIWRNFCFCYDRRPRLFFLRGFRVVSNMVESETITEQMISNALESESVFATLGQSSMAILSASPDVIADLVFDDLVNDRIPLEGIKNRSQSIGLVANCIIKGFETGFKQFLDTDRGQKLLHNLNSSDLLSRIGLASRQGGSNAFFIQQLRQRLSAIVQDALRDSR
jgi:hypothetical protein